MSLTTNKETDALFTALASSGAYMDLYSFFLRQEREEQDKLTELAVGALTKPELTNLAQVQLGRCAAMGELVSYAQKFMK